MNREPPAITDIATRKVVIEKDGPNGLVSVAIDGKHEVYCSTIALALDWAHKTVAFRESFRRPE